MNLSAASKSVMNELCEDRKDRESTKLLLIVLLGEIGSVYLDGDLSDELNDDNA